MGKRILTILGVVLILIGAVLAGSSLFETSLQLSPEPAGTDANLVIGVISLLAGVALVVSGRKKKTELEEGLKRLDEKLRRKKKEEKKR